MSKKTLNKTNLIDLGPEKLADLLLEVSTGSADIKRRLRFELSHHLGPDELGREVRKRLISLRKSKARTSWRKRKALVKDLQTQADMICDKIAPEDPNLAFDLLWEFVALSPSVYARVDDSRGEVGAVFDAARSRFADIAPLAMLDPNALALRVWDALQDDTYGEFDGIISLTASAMGDVGLESLKTLVQAYQDAHVTDESQDHEALRFLRSLRGDDNQPPNQRTRLSKAWLQEIAVVQRDVDAYAAQFSDQDLQHTDVAAEIAHLWIDAGRGPEALDLLEAAEPDGNHTDQTAWDAAYIRCLLDVGQTEDAQAHRWMCFEATLNGTHLRDYLKLIDDFEDVELEDRAKAYALAFPHFHTALGFFLDWPDLVLAAQLVQARDEEVDGDIYWLLAPAVDALRQRHPLAAVVLLRAMITATLDRKQVARYAQAAEHFSDCATLDAEIVTYGSFQSHLDFEVQIKRRHDDKAPFWNKLKTSN